MKWVCTADTIALAINQYCFVCVIATEVELMWQGLSFEFKC